MSEHISKENKEGKVKNKIENTTTTLGAPEIMEISINHKQETLELKQERINKLFEDVGGENGIIETLNHISPLDLVNLKQRIAETKTKLLNQQYTIESENSYIDFSWELTKALMNGGIAEIDEYDFLLEKLLALTGKVAGVPIGLTIASITGPIKAIQDIIRKTKVRLHKERLTKLENKLLKFKST